MATKFTPADVTHIAKLANIPVSAYEAKSLAIGFTATIAVIEKLNSIDIKNIPETHFTGLENVFREDEVDETRMFTQKQALANATHTHNGYFVVGQLIDQGNNP